jgi:hypothetical protein
VSCYAAWLPAGRRPIVRAQSTSLTAGRRFFESLVMEDRLEKEVPWVSVAQDTFPPWS